MQARIQKNKSRGATNPNNRPTGVKGSITATDTTRREQTVSHGFGRLFKKFLRVRIIKITSTWVAKDSINHPV